MQYYDRVVVLSFLKVDYLLLLYLTVVLWMLEVVVEEELFWVMVEVLVLDLLVMQHREGFLVLQ